MPDRSVHPALGDGIDDREPRTTEAAAPVPAHGDGMLLGCYLAGRTDAQAAFSDLVDRHLDTVHAVCARILPSAVVDDAVQTTFLLLLRKAPALRHETDLGKWLYFAARNVAMTMGRTEARRRRHERAAAAMTQEAVAPSAWDGVQARLDAALDSLPAAQREAIVLHILCGRTLSDAADSLKLPMRTLQTRVNRGLERLRRELCVSGSPQTPSDSTDAPASLLLLLLAHARTPAPAHAHAAAMAASHGSASPAALATCTAIIAQGRAGWSAFGLAAGLAALAAIGGVALVRAERQSPEPLAVSSPPLHPASVTTPLVMPTATASSRLRLSDRQYLQAHDRVVALAFLGGTGDFLVGGDRASLWTLGADRGHLDFAYPSRLDAAAVAPGGAMIATGYDDGVVRVWRVDGSVIATLRGHDQPVWSLAFSPDGRALASASDDSTVRLWEVESGHSLGVLRGSRDAVFAVSFAADGQTVISGGADGTVRGWDARTLVQRWSHAYPGHVHGVLHLPDRPLSIVAGHGGALQCVDDGTGETRATCATHLDVITCLAASPDGHVLALGSEDGQLAVWDTHAWIELGRLQLPGAIEACAFAPDGSSILIGGWDSVVRVVSCAGIAAGNAAGPHR